MPNDIYIRRVALNGQSSNKTAVELFNFIVDKLNEIRPKNDWGEIDYIYVKDETKLNQETE